MKLEVLTPKKIEFKDEAKEITLPTLAGEITILPCHTPIISILKEGRIKIKTAREDVVLQVDGGVLEVAGDRATILLKNFHAHYLVLS